jgi:hypothetical protein
MATSPFPMELPISRALFAALLLHGTGRIGWQAAREIIAWASKIATLEVGDVFACGTNHQGLGPMQDGETGTIEIERIGRMTVKVEDPQKRRWPVGIDGGIGKAVRQMKLTGVMPKPGEVFQTKRIA